VWLVFDDYFECFGLCCLFECVVGVEYLVECEVMCVELFSC